MLGGGYQSGDMQCIGGTGNSKCISGLFVGELGAVVGECGGHQDATSELLPGFTL